ncbi:sporulation integral membrane protein YtvI [Evansella cellulosilytica]|uniref:Sporulation integral membrane protein YtvI n=1 Tax=Evansella cellulosilytica (strain ATCC 21833 / DSM 2522 / FERM P-1141 / JCM 9156 / N-4) TaxID=649639 RepID=E6U0L9_EVAC2|nr:sporulation integral membrane protein YtvI [Evansella cellulosilytica]ADU31464.1 sporulation integral membrane protein YtvI [Evansella cellulosilytica DSM 2522]
MHKDTYIQRFIRASIVLTYLLLIIALIYILTIYLYPFLIGLIISLIFLPAVNFIENKFGWNRSSAVLLIIVFFILTFSALITLLVAEIVAGLSYLTKELPTYIHDGIEFIHLWFDTYLLPIYEGLIAFSSQLDPGQQTTIHQSLERLLSNFGEQMSNIIQYVLNGFADFLMALPNTITVLFFALLGAFFITKDWPTMMQWLESKTPKKIKVIANRMTEQWKKAIVGYVFAQLILVSMTGVIVFIGLLIIGVDYAITTALLIAIVDLLPYLGTGLVFIPWILYTFFSGHWGLAIGLSILYAIVIIQRNLAEPKVMSKHMGIPPLALLVSLFACYQLFGVLGLLLGPALLIFVQSVIRAGVIDEVFYYIKGR